MRPTTDQIEQAGLYQFTTLNELQYGIITQASIPLPKATYAQVQEALEQVPKLKEILYISKGYPFVVFYQKETGVLTGSTSIGLNLEWLASELEYFERHIQQVKKDPINIFVHSQKGYEAFLLTYYLNRVKKPVDQREIVRHMYQRQEYNFDTDLYARLFKETRLVAGDLVELRSVVDSNETITIYRGECSKSTHYTGAISWSLDYETAYFFATRFNSFGNVYQAQVKYTDVLAYINTRQENEIIVEAETLQGVQGRIVSK